MLDRLNQPISLRRRPKDDAPKGDAPKAATPKAQAPTGPARTASPGRFAALGKLNKPVSLRGSKPAAQPGPTAPVTSPADEAPVTDSPAPVKSVSLKRAPSLSGVRRPSRARTLVGLEIEPGQLVAARSHVNGQLVVDRAVGTPIPPNLVRDGEVSDVDELASALRELFDGSGLDRRVRIGIANQRIVMRQIELPPIPDQKELDAAVRFQAQDEIPMPIESVVLDYHALGMVETEQGPRMRVLLVAARRDMVERILMAARGAGLRPEGVDLAAFGMIRALRPKDLADSDRVLYLSVGGLTNLAIASGSTCEFTRAITSGLDQMVSEVASRVGIAFPDARRLVASVSPSMVGPRPLGETMPPLADADEPLTAAAGAEHADVARAALGDGIRRIAAEVRNSLDFHLGARGEQPVARAVLTGPALDLEGFDVALGRELGLPLMRGEVALASPEAAGHVPMSRLAVAAGLSVEEGPK
jgi:type IV pilus assembly protein PilM